MMTFRPGVRRRAVIGAGLVLTATFAIMARGCGHLGEGSVRVDPKVAARLGKFRGLPPAAYPKNKLEPAEIESRPRKNRSAR